jgi:hypothetical protein
MTPVSSDLVMSCLISVSVRAIDEAVTLDVENAIAAI